MTNFRKRFNRNVGNNIIVGCGFIRPGVGSSVRVIHARQTLDHGIGVSTSMLSSVTTSDGMFLLVDAANLVEVKSSQFVYDFRDFVGSKCFYSSFLLATVPSTGEAFRYLGATPPLQPGLLPVIMLRSGAGDVALCDAIAVKA